MPRKKSNRSAQNKLDIRPRFPEKTEYVIGPKTALDVMHQALHGIQNYRSGRLFIFKTLVGPLVPEVIRSRMEKLHLDEVSISYEALIHSIGNLFNVFVWFNLEEDSDKIKEHYRFIVLPYLELKLKKKIEHLERKRPFGWRIARRFYQRNLAALAPLVDNLVNLVALAWTFCPAIGEPEAETGFFNRFVFTSNGGFIDLGHFFNCSIISYLYDAEHADRRAEATEISQRKLRSKQWLVTLRERNYLRLLTNLLWGYATSADTIEDRASDKLGIHLGTQIRKLKDNGKLIDYFMTLYPKLVRSSLQIFGKQSWLQRNLEVIWLFFQNLFYTARQSATMDIEQYMKDFFDEYDAIDPDDRSVVPEGLFKSIIDFYTEKYFGREWDRYTCPEWEAVIPQDLWEQVVKGRPKFQPRLLPIKVQLKATGERVAPY